MKIWTSGNGLFVSVDTDTNIMRILDGLSFEERNVECHINDETCTVTGDGINATLSTLDGHISQVTVDSVTFSGPASVKGFNVVERKILDDLFAQVVDTNNANVEIAVYAYSDNSVSTHSISTLDTDRLPTASSRKAAILYELSRQAQLGIININTVITINESDRANGSSVIAEMTMPQSFTIDRLAQYMIENSDNTATYKLLSIIGIENVNNLLKVMQLDEFVEGNGLGLIGDPYPVFSGGGWTAPLDYYLGGTFTTAYAILMATVWTSLGRVLDPTWTSWALGYLHLVNDRNRAYGGFPNTVHYTGKPGSISGDMVPRPTEDWDVQPGIAADSCIIEFAGEKFAFSVLAEGSNSIGSEYIREIASIIGDYFVGGLGYSAYRVITRD